MSNYDPNTIDEILLNEKEIVECSICHQSIIVDSPAIQDTLVCNHLKCIYKLYKDQQGGENTYES
jgi:hypothetical protein